MGPVKRTRPARRRPLGRLITGGSLIILCLGVVIGLTAVSGAPAPAVPATATTAPPTVQTRPVPPPATQELHGSAPLRITYPGVGMDQDVIPLTPAQGNDSIVPPMTIDAYWLTPYGAPGSSDTTYIVGHSWDGRDTAFNHLSTQAKAGDQITITTAAGPATYTVQSVTTETKKTLKNSAIWNKVPNTLILISCYTADLWGTNIIVTAGLARDPRATHK